MLFRSVLPSAWLRPPKNIVRAVEWRKVLLEGEGFVLVALGAWGLGQAERLEGVDGLVFGERGVGLVALVQAVVAVEVAGPRGSGRGVRRQAGKGVRGRRDGLGVRRLQAPLLAALESRYARGDHEPGQATACWKGRAAFGHRGGHAHRGRLHNLEEAIIKLVASLSRTGSGLDRDRKSVV